MIILFFGFIIFVVIILLVVNKFSQEKEDTYSPKQEEEELPPLRFPVPQKNNQPKKMVTPVEQQRLVNQYVNSDLMKQILNYICNGNYRIYKPREIIINHDDIRGDVSGRIITYDFVSNRVPVFKPIGKACSVEKDLFEDFVRPQVAMAEAINMIMGNEYEIYDRGDIKYKVQGDDGFMIYSSNYVQMRLKATKHF